MWSWNILFILKFYVGLKYIRAVPLAALQNGAMVIRKERAGTLPSMTEGKEIFTRVADTLLHSVMVGHL